MFTKNLLHNVCINHSLLLHESAKNMTIFTELQTYNEFQYTLYT
jgi:hypothetical protein